MFRVLARLLTAPFNDLTQPPNSDALFAVHPLQLSRWLEEMWALNGTLAWPTAPGVQPAFPGSTAVVGTLGMPVAPGGVPPTNLGGLVATVPSGLNGLPGQFVAPTVVGTNLGHALPWEHLVYAYLVESTGVVEILAEVVRRYVVGETLEIPGATTQAWARATEELFFRDPPLFHITGTVSQVRPDARTNRRNAYWRMFGLDLPHPLRVEGHPWKTDVGSHNQRFGELWTEFLREVWLGIQNDSNAVGPNPTNVSRIAYLAQTLSELLRLRRRNDLLTREEYAYVATLSWFHATVETDNAVVNDLQAGAGAVGDPADRLTKIGRRVGISPPRGARELFELASLVSPVLRFVEAGRFNDASGAELLYRSTSSDPVVRETMNRIIDLWQSATGVNLKGRDVRTWAEAPAGSPPGPSGPSGPSAAPTPAGRRGANGVGAPVTNGTRPVAPA